MVTWGRLLRNLRFGCNCCHHVRGVEREQALFVLSLFACTRDTARKSSLVRSTRTHRTTTPTHNHRRCCAAKPSQNPEENKKKDKEARFRRRTTYETTKHPATTTSLHNKVSLETLFQLKTHTHTYTTEPSLYGIYKILSRHLKRRV